MKYRIKSSLIEPSWFESIIFETLRMSEAGKDMTDCPLNVFQRNYQRWGGRHRDIIVENLELTIQDRLKEVITLFESIKKNGYKEIAPFSVWFDDDGFIRLYDGHHRLSILRYLHLDPLVTISTDWDSKGIDPTCIKGRDFPLIEIASSIWGCKRLYHFVNDPNGRFKGFSVQRPDTVGRRDFLMSHMIGTKVLDIGCSEGYLTHELAKFGFDVTGVERGYLKDKIDRGRKLLAIARYLATIQGLKVKYLLTDWKDLLREQDLKFDTILYLSVLHNEINEIGEGPAFENLTLFRGKAKRLFIEIPDIKKQPDWSFVFKIADVVPKLERVIKMKFEQVWENGYRPILVFTDPFYEDNN